MLSSKILAIVLGVSGLITTSILTNVVLAVLLPEATLMLGLLLILPHCIFIGLVMGWLGGSMWKA
jgi:hypothetical protein